MLRLAVLILTALHLDLGTGQDVVLVDEPNVLTPPYFNIATGKKIESTATCGQDEPQVFCKLTGGPNEYGFNENLYQGQFCDTCDVNDPTKAHPIKYAIDGTEKWWQSPPLSQGSQFNKINVTIHLGQVFHVAYVIIKFANSPRAGTWVLERSSDHGKTFQPWQYFANSDSDCHNLFGIDAFEEITSDDSVICTSEYSDVVPLERGEVIVSIINRRPGGKNFSHSPVLQEWSKATDVRLRLLRTKTLLGHLMAVQRQDPTVTRRYFYSIKDISIGGRCVCNGHADTCSPDPLDRYKLKCECRHNTCGDSCEYCCPGFVQKEWRAAVPESANECELCNCHGHSTECAYDEQVAIRRQSLDLAGNYEGGGVCQNCAHNTAGINCEKCVDGYYRPANVDPRDPNGCRPCECDSAFTVGTCEPVTGRCYCQPKYAGDKCDRCAPGYHLFPECEPCPCYYNATRGGICEPLDDVCPCKYNFAGKYCSECAPGFYNFPECAPCACHGQGAISDICDAYSGQCTCDEGFGGLYCDQCSAGYYNYPLCQTCACLNTFTTEDVCDPETGKCFCTELVTGESCNQCLPGYYDFPQCKECECGSPGSASNLCDQGSGRCMCKPNYQGSTCEECAPEYYNYPNCIPCDCDVQGSQRTTCDAETGQCTCFSYIAGRRCDQCAPDYFNFPRCEDCTCDPRGIKSIVPGVCLAFTTGQCDCKENVIGKYCNECSPLHYNLTLGCIDCNCFLQGTLDGVAACDSENGDCWCKPYTCTQRCSQCDDGFFGLEESNYFGCTGCQCDAGGALSEDCDTVDGQCQCKLGVVGRQCNEVAEGYYYPTLLQHRFEVEDGKTTEDNILRFGFSQDQFPSFSGKGYGEFSLVQRKITVPVNVESYGLYRILFYYVHPDDTSTANVTLAPSTAAGSEQKFQVEFEPTSVPALMTAKNVFVLNRGEWNIIIEGDPGLLIDYIVLLPSEYYEPGILQAKITEPCKPTLAPAGKECLMYTHPNLDHTAHAVLTGFTDKAQHDSPTTAHPTMVLLDGNSLDDENKRMTVSLDDLAGPGKYVLVLTYASSGDSMQTVEATVTDGAGREFEGVKFNAYSCEYSFLCRQVALTDLSDVMVFDISVPNMRIDLSVDAGEVVYVKGIHAIPYDTWTMEYVEPKRRCITKEGPEFDECIAWAYPIPVTARKIEVSSGKGDDKDGGDIDGGVDGGTVDGGVDGGSGDGGDKDKAPTATNPDVDTKRIGGEDNTIEIDMDLPPGRYVFVLHYYNPNHLSFSPDVVISGGLVHEGTANVTYCPNGDGCRGVVTSNTGAVVLDITSTPQKMTITVPKDKEFWLDYVLAIPEDAYNAGVLEPSPTDHSRKFFDQCYGVGSEGLIESAKEPSEFCKSAVFSLTMDFNDGALPCECSGAGTVGGGDVDCNDYGGQCPCKPNVIGRQCDRCKTGFFGFPNCEPCDCGGALCDEVSGECICPPNTVSPACDECLPFTHSFHPLAGCVSCKCHPEGVEDADDLGCSKEDGQCRCKENVEGQRCDKCKPGFFGFPECRPCVCDRRGRKSEGCDPVSGQCLCKEHVEGQQCDRCKPGAFYLNENNPLGCTSCFCFGASTECSSTQYPVKEITDMDGWRLLNLKTDKPDVVREGQSAYVDVFENGGAIEPSRANLFWAAPKTYLNNQIGSYGGVLHFVTNSERGGRGDSTNTFVPANTDQPAPLTAATPSVILEGNGMKIQWVNRNKQGDSAEVSLNLTEANFVHQSTGNSVRREEMMMVLSPLNAMHIHASDDPDARIVRISDVSLSSTDYEADLGSGPTIPTVEICECPKGYTGESCQFCDTGHYRESRGPYLGYCAECDCYGHCDACDSLGQLGDKYKCLHNTAGKNCEKCKDGYIGDAKSGDPDACQPCPCPFPSEDGSFADTCEYDADGDVICHCQTGYTGEKCDQCEIGYFGNPSVIGGTCKTCNCHGNLDYNLLMETCDRVTGECKDCLYNTGGKYCERCADGYFGDAKIAKNCTKCPCDECGTLQCDHTYGFCACKAHVIGKKCDRCEPGYYNLESCTGCQDCSCDIGARNDECNVITGECECAPNVVGMKCDKCAPGHWDYSAMGCKPCNCRNGGDCNPVNGACYCPPGITGPQCDQCELDRHILPLGGLKCESCDTCTDDLLDTIEPITKKVQKAADELSKVSVGVAAAKRLDDYDDRSDSAAVQLDAAEEYISDLNDDADKLLNAEANGIDGVLSENDADESSGIAPAPIINGAADDEEDSYVALKTAVGKTEQAVTAMCNQTDELLEDTEKTNGRMKKLDNNTVEVTTELSDFEIASKDLLDKLEEETSGDSDDYLRKLNEAEMLLERMKLRVFKPMKDVADAELLEAETLFGLVNKNFTLPSENLDQRVGDVSQDLSDKVAKMKELRTRLNEVINTVTEVSTMNAANSKALAAAKDAIARINIQWNEINQIIGDAQNVLDTKGEEEPEIYNGDALLEAIEQLEVVNRTYVEGLEGKEELVNRSLEKAYMLQHDADILSQLVDETKNDPRNQRAAEAANRYRTIVNVMEEAREAADKADLDATGARDDVAKKNLGGAADKANADSGALLSDVQTLKKKKVGRLEKDFDVAKGSADAMGKLAKGISDRLDAINNGILNLNHGDIEGSVQKTKDDSKMASDTADEALEEARKLQEQINQAPDPNVPLANVLTSVKVILNELPENIQEVNAQIDRLKKRASKMALLPGDLKLDYKMDKIRKWIELSRSRADSVKISMKFKKKALAPGEKPEYSQVYIPRQAYDIEDHLKVEMYVNVSKSADNSLMYLGDASSENGDYVALETIGGNVHYYYKVGRGVGELVSDEPINDEKWHRIVIERDGNVGKLTVEYQAEEGRGDSFGTDGIRQFYDDGVTDSGDSKATLPVATTPMVMGGLPPIPLPERIQNHQMSGCIEGLKVNEENVGLWNFVSYAGPQPGKTCEGDGSVSGASNGDSRWWRFRGVDSYLRITEKSLKRDDYHSNTGVSIVRFKLKTQQSNGLLFFIGETTDQFFALELRENKLVLTCNFGWAEPRKGVSRVFTTLNQPFVVKFGIVDIGRDLQMIALVVNSRLAVNMTFAKSDPDVKGDVWFGGLHRNNINPAFSAYVTTMHENYRGCIYNLAFHVRSGFNIYDADERVGVTPGCAIQLLPPIGTVDHGYITIAENYPRVDKMSGSTVEEPDEPVVPDLVTPPTEAPITSTTTTQPETTTTTTTESTTSTTTEAPEMPPPTEEQPKVETVTRDEYDYYDSVTESGSLHYVNEDVPSEEDLSNDDPNILLKSYKKKDVMKSKAKVDPMNSESDLGVVEIPLRTPSESVILEEKEIVIAEEKENGESEIVDVTDIELEVENAIKNDADSTMDDDTNVELPPVMDAVPNKTDPPPQKEDEIGELADQPVIDLKENAQVAKKGDNFAEDEGTTTPSVLPVVLIVIGVIVGVVLLAAVVSAIMKGGLFAGGSAAPANPPPASMEQAPLNNVQAQRVAQMDW